MPLVSHKIYRLSVFSHYQAAALVANNTASGMAHGQVRENMFVPWQPLTFVGVVHIQRCAVLRYHEAGGDGIHSVCAPSVTG